MTVCIQKPVILTRGAEFIDEMPALNGELEKLDTVARELEAVIGRNIRLIAGEK